MEFVLNSFESNSHWWYLLLKPIHNTFLFLGIGKRYDIIYIRTLWLQDLADNFLINFFQPTPQRQTIDFLDVLWANSRITTSSASQGALARLMRVIRILGGGHLVHLARPTYSTICGQDNSWVAHFTVKACIWESVLRWLTLNWVQVPWWCLNPLLWNIQRKIPEYRILLL